MPAARRSRLRSRPSIVHVRASVPCAPDREWRKSIVGHTCQRLHGCSSILERTQTTRLLPAPNERPRRSLPCALLFPAAHSGFALIPRTRKRRSFACRVLENSRPAAPKECVRPARARQPARRNAEGRPAGGTQSVATTSVSENGRSCWTMTVMRYPSLRISVSA